MAYEARIVSRQSAEITEETHIHVDSLHRCLSVESSLEDVDASWSFGPDVYGYGVSYPDVHYTLHVPASASVRIDDQASAVEVTGLAGLVEIETEAGDMDVSQIEAAVRIDSEEGTTSVSDVTGDLTVDAGAGTVTVDGVKGRLHLDLHEARAEVVVDSLDTVNIDTDEGFVTLAIPHDVGFALSSEVGEGAVLEGEVDFRSLREGGKPLSRNDKLRWATRSTRL